MASVRERFSPEFLPGALFLGEHVFRGFSGAPAVIRNKLEHPHFTFRDKGTGFPRENYFHGLMVTKRK
jgi:hypothetical protein